MDVNRYAYAANDPVNGSDGNGHAMGWAGQSCKSACQEKRKEQQKKDWEANWKIVKRYVDTNFSHVPHMIRNDLLHHWKNLKSDPAQLLSDLGSLAQNPAAMEAGALATGLGGLASRLKGAGKGTSKEILGDFPRLAAPPMHKHHLLPQQFHKFFASKGIDINRHTVEMTENAHLKGVHGSGNGSLPGKWNQSWQSWIESNPNASAKEVYQHLGSMMDRYGMSHMQVTPY